MFTRVLKRLPHPLVGGGARIIGEITYIPCITYIPQPSLRTLRRGEIVFVRAHHRGEIDDGDTFL